MKLFEIIDPISLPTDRIMMRRLANHFRSETIRFVQPSPHLRLQDHQRVHLFKTRISIPRSATVFRSSYCFTSWSSPWNNGSKSFPVIRSFWSRSSSKPNDFQDDSSTSISSLSKEDSPIQPPSSFDSTSSTNIAPEQAITDFERFAAAVSQQQGNSPLPDSSEQFTAVWYYPQDHLINLINYVHDMSGLNYAVTIAIITTTIRVIVFPLFVEAQRNTSRMAHMKPEMDVLKQRIDRLDPSDRDGQIRLSLEMKKLFLKYQCNPLKALTVPFIQAPVFMSMFFALRKMPDYYHDELSKGGILWFQDLTATDPFYILPVVSALTFLGMMEIGKSQMMSSSPEHGRIMITVFRGLAIIMVPITIQFSTAIFCYWTTNNTISFIQSALFRNAEVRKSLGIWEMPKVLPQIGGGLTNPPKGLLESVQDVIKNANKKGDTQNLKDKIKSHNEAIENRKRADALRKERITSGTPKKLN